jgi:topoisomerase-4 subunit A
MDVDEKDPLVSVATIATVLKVQGQFRNKPKEEDLKGAALNAHAGKRARRGKSFGSGLKPQRIVEG